MMPTAEDYQALHDELQQIGAVLVQAFNLQDQELGFWAIGSLASAAAKPGWWAREAADNAAETIAAAAIVRAKKPR